MNGFYGITSAFIFQLFRYFSKHIVSLTVHLELYSIIPALHHLSDRRNVDFVFCGKDADTGGKCDMADRDLRKLNRSELIEIIYALQQSEKTLRTENELLNRRLEERTIFLTEPGSIAEAALGLNHVFESAQAAADQYLYSIRAAAHDAQTRATQILTEAEQQAERLRSNAQAAAEQYLNSIHAAACDAQARATQILTEAEQQTACLRSNAQSDVEQEQAEYNTFLERQLEPENYPNETGKNGSD
ncbi:MAG: hypothetical protein LIO55_04145 [Oscillospiraceae bacterium]|nr:hypothetical protein [Oscillospiraceae bacterium]